MSFVGASLYKTGKLETKSFSELGSSFSIRKITDDSAEVECFELNEVDYDKFGKVSIKDSGEIVAFEFVEM